MRNKAQTQPLGYLTTGAIVFLLVLIAWAFAGCVTIASKEREKTEIYEAGEIDMAKRVLNSIDTYENLDEMKDDLRAIIGVSHFNKK